MRARRSIFRSAAVVSFFTILSRIAGLARDIVVSRLLGTTHSADAFNMAYRIPNLLRRLTAEGAASAAFIPVFTSELNRAGKESALRIANTSFYLVTFAMTALTVLGILFAPAIIWLYAIGFGETVGKVELTVLLARIMFPYMLLISIAALGMGVLNSMHIFGPSAASPVLLNLAIIFAALLVSPRFEEPAIALAFGVVAGGLLQMLIQVPALLKVDMSFRWSFDLHQPALRRMGKLMLPGLFGISITQINVFIDSTFGSLLGEGAVTALYLSDRVMEFILGVYVIAIATAILPTISRIAASEKWEEFSQTFYYGMRMVAFMTVPAMAGLILMRFRIISVLFESGKFNAASTALTAAPLVYFALGLAGFSALKIVIPTFYAQQDTRTPVKSAAAALVTNLVANYLLLRPLGVGGPALATTLAGYVNFLSLYWIVRKKMVRNHEAGLGLSVSRSLVATVPMSVFLWWARDGSAWQVQGRTVQLLLLGTTIAAAAAIYFAGAWLVGSQELREFRRLAPRRDAGNEAS